MNNLKYTTLFFQLILPFIILMMAAIIYFRIARHFKIIDRPNERSSHTAPTIRGAGIIFLLSTLLFYLWNGYSFPYLLMAILISGIVSFVDDIRVVNNQMKFGVHVVAVLLIFQECGLLTSLYPLYLIAIGILIIGVINAYNFMDGINGITGLYSLSVIFPLFITETNAVLQSLELFSIIALLVFNFYNTRTHARCFAGDVGSISLAILIVFFLMMRVIENAQFEYLGLLLLYGIDTIHTIAQRLYQKENIFKPHRKHLYQYFSNEKKVPHVLVSILYAFLQLIINLAIIYGYFNFPGVVILFVLLSIIYWRLKIPLIRITTAR